jgi:probable O-glycosylation ligase (exosortase A-associated)
MLRLTFLLAVVVFGLCAATVDAFYGLLLYLWFAYFRPQEWVWVDVTALRLSLIIAVALVARSLAAGKFPDVSHPLSWALISLVFAAFIAELTTIAPRPTWDWLTLVAQNALIVLLLVTLVDSPRKIRLATIVVTASLGFHTAKHGLTTILSPGTRLTEGVGGSFGDNNSYAVLASMVALMLLALAKAATNWRASVAFTVAGGLSVLTVIATFSRGGFLAITVGLVVYALVRRVPIGWIAGAACAAGLLFTLAPLPEGYTDRLETIQTYKDDESASSRLHFWRVALDISSEQPLGVGIQNFNHVFDRYDYLHGRFGQGRSVHNSHLQVLTEAGVFGFIVWVAAIAYTIVLGFRIRARGRLMTNADGAMFVAIADGQLAAFTAFIVGGTFTAIGWNDFVWCLFGMTAALDRVSWEQSQVAVQCATLKQPSSIAYAETAGLEGWVPRARRVDATLRERVSRIPPH